MLLSVFTKAVWGSLKGALGVPLKGLRVLGFRASGLGFGGFRVQCIWV